MFFRIKPSGGRRYLQIVENKRVDGKVRQVVRLTIGRMDELEASGQLARLLASGARHCEQMMLLSAMENEATTLSMRRFGAPLLFGRLWQESGIAAVLEELLAGRQFATKASQMPVDCFGMPFAEPIWAGGRDAASRGRTHDRSRTAAKSPRRPLEPCGPSTHAARHIVEDREVGQRLRPGPVLELESPATRRLHNDVGIMGRAEPLPLRDLGRGRVSGAERAQDRGERRLAAAILRIDQRKLRQRNG